MIARYSETQIVATVDRLTVAQLRSYVASECLSPNEEGGRLLFSDADVARVELLLDLSESYDMDPDALSLVVSLIDRLHNNRREFRALRLAIEELHTDTQSTIRDAYTRNRGR